MELFLCKQTFNNALKYYCENGILLTEIKMGICRNQALLFIYTYNYSYTDMDNNFTKSYSTIEKANESEIKPIFNYLIKDFNNETLYSESLRYDFDIFIKRKDSSFERNGNIFNLFS